MGLQGIDHELDVLVEIDAEDHLDDDPAGQHVGIGGEQASSSLGWYTRTANGQKMGQNSLGNRSDPFSPLFPRNVLRAVTP
jgi:hypothetical protein